MLFHATWEDRGICETLPDTNGITLWEGRVSCGSFADAIIAIPYLGRFFILCPADVVAFQRTFNNG